MWTSEYSAAFQSFCNFLLSLITANLALASTELVILRDNNHKQPPASTRKHTDCSCFCLFNLKKRKKRVLLRLNIGAGSMKATVSRALLSSELVSHVASFTRSVLFPVTRRCVSAENALSFPRDSYVGIIICLNRRTAAVALHLIFTLLGSNQAQLHIFPELR